MMKLLKAWTTPRPELDTEQIRCLGLELQGLAAAHVALVERINPIMEKLAVPMASQRLDSETGEEFKQLYIELNRIQCRISCCGLFTILAQQLSEVGLAELRESARQAALEVGHRSHSSYPSNAGAPT